MMIPDAKDDPILRDSSQEPPTFSKYDFEDGGSWHTSNNTRDMYFDT